MTEKSVLTQLQLDLLVGCLLGDGNLQTNNKNTWKASFIHKAIHEPYIQHKYNTLQNFCETEPKYGSYFDLKSNKEYSRFQFNTLSKSEFRFLGGMFYKKDKESWVKHVPKNIKKFLTPVALAYWYMDAGALKWKGHSNAVRLCTDSFSKSDVELLKSALEINFNLKCSIQLKNNLSRISILEESYPELKSLILPHLLPCMYYKFPDGNNGVLENEDISQDIRNTFKI